MQILKNNKNIGGRILLVTLLVFSVMTTSVHAGKGVYDWAFVELDYTRKEKVQQLKHFCDRIHHLALQASKDKFLIACFDINRQYAVTKDQGEVPSILSAKVDDLRGSLNNYYIANYLAFYDLMFVDMNGDIFYTIRKESDLHSNIFQGDLANSALAHRLKEKPRKEAFVDFFYWGPSSEPAAFFIEPVRKDGVLTGWMILQIAVNKINTLIAWTENLGQTGETFLVNREGYMLTESNFEGASTILKKRLDDRNIQAKFADGQGHRTVTDYRRCVAFTSFEVVNFLETHWLVVAKVDRDEIITNHYVRHHRYYADRLMTHLEEGLPVPLKDPEPLPSLETKRVDMDEFLKAEKGGRLHTFGVSTCTGILASYPGKFAYMAHISPRDRIYGAHGTNLLGQMVKKIKSFDTYRTERRKVVFILAATHLDSLLTAVDKLVEEGFLLSQIFMMYDPRATSLAISYDHPDDRLRVKWRFEESVEENRVHCMEDARNIGDIIRLVMEREEEAVREKERSDRIL